MSKVKDAVIQLLKEPMENEIVPMPVLNCRVPLEVKAKLQFLAEHTGVGFSDLVRQLLGSAVEEALETCAAEVRRNAADEFEAELEFYGTMHDVIDDVEELHCLQNGITLQRIGLSRREQYEFTARQPTLFDAASGVDTPEVPE